MGNTLGYVSLTDENQKYIREISSRLDIIQNDTSEAFKMVINVIFNKLFYELNRSANNILRTVFEQNGLLGVSLKNQMKKNLNEIVNATSKTKSVSYKLQKAINMVKEECQKDLISKETVEKIVSIMEETSEHIEEEKKIQQQATVLLNEASEQLKTVEIEAYNNFKLMANGLITETITHELDSVCKTSKASDVVIHFDPWWNPAIEDQATDRAHRFGQKNVVEVIKLISKGSIEEKIIKLQESKKEIINEIMNGNYTNGGFLSSLDADEIKELFS